MNRSIRTLMWACFILWNGLKQLYIIHNMIWLFWEFLIDNWFLYGHQLLKCVFSPLDIRMDISSINCSWCGILIQNQFGSLSACRIIAVEIFYIRSIVVFIHYDMLGSSHDTILLSMAIYLHIFFMGYVTF